MQKLRLFPAEIPSRQEKADRYNQGLASVVEVPLLMPGATSVWAQYTIITEDRDGLAKACREAGVPTAIHYTASLNRLPPYRHVPTPPAGVPQAEWLAERVISLPMHPYLTDAMQDLVIGTVREAIGDDTEQRAADRKNGDEWVQPLAPASASSTSVAWVTPVAPRAATTDILILGNFF